MDILNQKHASTLVASSHWASLPLFDRTGWKRMAFGEFADSIGERAEPKDAQEEIYVGLEHLDPQSLHIRRWGKGSDVIGGKLRFRKGDIIFGKRRAYQRKLAVAEFGGICSAHAMVIRARPDKVLPEFLPFLMMSDRFMNRAVEISVGSLSPTINWTTLKLEEFDLPPLDQQRRIAEILWAVDATNVQYDKSQKNLEQLSLLERWRLIDFKGNGAPSNWQPGTIEDLCEVLDSKRRPLNETERSKMQGSIPYYGATGIVDHINDFIFDEPLILVAEDGGPFHEYAEKPIAYFVTGKSWVNNHAHVLRPRSHVNARWLYHGLRNADLSKFISGTTRTKLTMGALRSIKLKYPPFEAQCAFAENLDHMDSTILALRESSRCLAEVLHSILNTVFSKA